MPILPSSRASLCVLMATLFFGTVSPVVVAASHARDQPSPACTGTQISQNWIWTQDDRGGGSQSSLTVRSDTATIAVPDFVFYTNLDAVYGNGTYCFKVLGTDFVFSWKIAPANPSQGTALNLQSAPSVWGSALAIGAGQWDGSLYRYHNGSYFWNTGALTYDPTTWHEVTIQDSGTAIAVTFDGVSVNLFTVGQHSTADFESIVGPGYVGIGAQAGKSVSYADMRFEAPTAVRATTWGAIKALLGARATR